MIYFDNNATTFLDPDVQAVMCEYILKGGAANPSSVHAAGRDAKLLLMRAKDQVAKAIGVSSDEVLFTSCATESAAIFFQQFFRKYPTGHVISSTVEHPCVYDLVKAHPNHTLISPGSHGGIRLDQVKEAMRPDTRLVALMAVNNETGVLSEIDQIGAFCKEQGLAFFIDGVALVGKGKVVLPEGQVAFSLSGHKLHAPKGIGALILRRGFKGVSLQRPGTENLLGAIALGKACEIATAQIDAIQVHLIQLRDHFETCLLKQFEWISVNGKGERIGNTSNLLLHPIDGEAVMMELDLKGIACGMGSACRSGGREPSRVLKEMGLSYQQAGGALRFSFSRLNTIEEVNQALDVIGSVLLKKLS